MIALVSQGEADPEVVLAFSVFQRARQDEGHGQGRERSQLHLLVLYSWIVHVGKYGAIH